MRWMAVGTAEVGGITYSVAATPDDKDLKSVSLLAKADGVEGGPFCFAWTLRGRIHGSSYLRGLEGPARG